MTFDLGTVLERLDKLIADQPPGGRHERVVHGAPVSSLAASHVQHANCLVTSTISGSVPMASSLHICGDSSIRLLALERGPSGDETYHVSFSPAPGAVFRSGLMRYAGGESWDLTEGRSASCTNVVFGSPDEVFRLALGESHVSQRALAERVTEAAPHWPTSLTERLARRRVSGAGTVSFDARWFLSELASSAFDRPILFPDATSKLGLAGLERASAIVRGIATDGEAHDNALANVLLRALSAERTSESALGWDGDGRLIGEYVNPFFKDELCLVHGKDRTACVGANERQRNSADVFEGDSQGRGLPDGNMTKFESVV